MEGHSILKTVSVKDDLYQTGGSNWCVRLVRSIEKSAEPQYGSQITARLAQNCPKQMLDPGILTPYAWAKFEAYAVPEAIAGHRLRGQHLAVAATVCRAQ